MFIINPSNPNHTSVTDSDPKMPSYVLGIDIGTTSVKACILDLKKEVIASASKPTIADIPSDYAGPGSLQDVPKIIAVLQETVEKLPSNLLEKVVRIGICGQMHGVVLWSESDGKPPWSKVIGKNGKMKYQVIPEQISPLYTWQDKRCDKTLLQSLPPSESHLPTHSGYGTATLFWLLRYKKSTLMEYNCAGTIHDFVVAMLCGLEKPVMSIQNAASWGYFDCLNNQWNLRVLESADFPISLLPRVCQNEEIAGDLSDSWLLIPIGTYMGVALGDLQCSVLATIELPNDAILNFSTSAQMCFVAKNYKPKLKPTITPTEYFPFFNNEFLCVAASLNGGNVLSSFVSMVQNWTKELGSPVSEAKIWETLVTQGRQKPAASLKVQPTLLGERYQPDLTAAITEITTRNLGLGSVFHSLCEGLVENICKMMPKELLRSNGINRIVGNGNALSKNEVLQSNFQRMYHLPLVMHDKPGDAAKGAAIAVISKIKDDRFDSLCSK